MFLSFCCRRCTVIRSAVLGPREHCSPSSLSFFPACQILLAFSCTVRVGMCRRFHQLPAERGALQRATEETSGSGRACSRLALRGPASSFRRCAAPRSASEGVPSKTTTNSHRHLWRPARDAQRRKLERLERAGVHVSAAAASARQKLHWAQAENPPVAAGPSTPIRSVS